MNEEVRIADLDVFYISFDEPLKERFWSDLSEKVPWADRVDGVVGFDAAHKECARRAGTRRFITVDGDNIADEGFFGQTLNIPEAYRDHVLSWAGRNSVNGLVYGNGGIKCWTRDAVLDMRSHETAQTDSDRVEFCWGMKYAHMRGSFSTTHPAGSPYQGFRSGFREGVKMLLLNGHVSEIERFQNQVWDVNLKRLKVWSGVGRDTPNGVWAILGARMGTHALMVDRFDHHVIADYSWFADYWNGLSEKFSGNDEVCPWTGYRWDHNAVLDEIERVGKSLEVNLGFRVTCLDPQSSAFFKDIYQSPPRSRLVFEVE